MTKEIDDVQNTLKQKQENIKEQDSNIGDKPLPDEMNQDDAKMEKDQSNEKADAGNENNIKEIDHNEVIEEESVLNIPEDVQDLLEDISTENPEGLDIESSEDDEAISILIDFEAEMEKRSGNDYNKCLGWGKILLQNHYKNLNVAVWLTIAWFRLAGLSGLNKGLLTLAELINKYGEKCFPRNKEKQARVFSSLNNDPRLLILKKITFEEEIPIYKVTSEILDSSRAKEELPRELLFKMTRFKEHSFSGEKKFLDDLKNELFPKDDKKSKMIDQNEEKLLNIFRESKTDEEPTKFSVTDRFINTIQFIGDFKKYEDLFLGIKDEQFTSSERFIDELNQRFIDNNVDIQTIKQYQSLFTCLGNNIIANLLDLKDGYEHFNKSLELYFGENVPELSNLAELIGKSVADAEQLVSKTINNAQVQSEAQQLSGQKQEKQSEETSEIEGTTETIPTTADKPLPSAIKKLEPEVRGEEEINAQSLKITRETESLIAMKKALIFYFREEKTVVDNEGKTRKEKVLKVTSDPRIYGISRCLRWDNIKVLPNDNTQLGPDEVKQKYLQSKLNEGDFDTVIADFESNFIENEQLQFWLDGQRLVTQALIQKGVEWGLCAQEIKFHLAKLLYRLPDLPKLTFRDKKTPYANQDTQKWIEKEIMGVMGSTKSQEKILPPIIGEDYQSINDEYEKACDQPLDKFEENAKIMQQAIAGDLRVKGKFLRKLCLANYCYWANKYDLANVLFDELIQHIEEYHIIEWEKALCVSVWQAMYRNNMKLLDLAEYKDQKGAINNQNKELITKISKYDVVLALNLTKHEGE